MFVSCSGSSCIFGALRKSELVAQSKEDQSWRALLFQDVQFSDFSIVLQVQQSKTEKIGKGCNVSLGFCSELELCPVVALRTYISLRGRAGLLFVHRGGEGGRDHLHSISFGQLRHEP